MLNVATLPDKDVVTSRNLLAPFIAYALVIIGCSVSVDAIVTIA